MVNPNMDKQETVRIIGIDPALRVSGYAVIDVPAWSAETSSKDVLPIELLKAPVKIVEAGVIRVGDAKPMEQRLLQIQRSLTEILEELKPQQMAVEKLYAHYERTQPAILMGHARGVILLAAGQQGIPVTGYAATEVKKTVAGNGRAPKTQMQAAVCRHLGLTTAPEPHDVADALAIALCHFFSSSSPLRSAMP